METRVICPNCGATMNLDEHERLCAGMTIAKDSNLGDVYLDMSNNTVKANVKENKNMTKNEERLAAMVSAGIDTSKFFNITMPNGDEVIMTTVNGIPTVASEEDLQIRENIFENGYVKNTALHRRWVMAQMFRMLESKYGFDDALRRKGFRYSYKMTLEELRVQTKLDENTFAERNLFFNKKVALHMAKYFVSELRREFDRRAENPKMCKKTLPYLTINGEDIFVDDIEKKVFSNNGINWAVRQIEKADNARQLYGAFNDFMARTKRYFHYLDNAKLDEFFVQAYKGSGAYYTLKNMVMNHDVLITEYDMSKWNYKSNPIATYSGTVAVDFLRRQANDHASEGFKFLGMLRQCIKDNDFDWRQSIADNQ